MKKKIIITICVILIVTMLFNFNSLSTFGKKTSDFRKPIDYVPISHNRHCGNGICEYNLGETPMNCPQDCFLS